ncbi:hypothetical protein E2C01_069379 [Portunus trituberculatus]|uniref:Uncharacterized protein n=1 Tax=Portunus trituberculatus TaxID=210409 RepID=A0A5B7HZ75_PORTR|nr:hypothetical protein [Portunus trituberculatus]
MVNDYDIYTRPSDPFCASKLPHVVSIVDEPNQPKDMIGEVFGKQELLEPLIIFGLRKQQCCMLSTDTVLLC